MKENPAHMFSYDKFERTGLQQPKPVLTITSGFARKAAKDEYGLSYIEFEHEFFDDHDDRRGCDVCSEPVDKGWLLLDGGEVYHYDCVEVREEK